MTYGWIPTDMTITTLDGVVNALGNNSSRFILDKASISNAAAGQYHSLFRATGQPGQGAIPTTAAICTNPDHGSYLYQCFDWRNELHAADRTGHDVWRLVKRDVQQQRGHD